MNQEKINFPVIRDFSGLFNVSVKFISQNFKHFFQSMLFIAGPFLLISAICSGIFQTYILEAMPASEQGFALNYMYEMQYFGWQYFFIVLVGIFGRVILLTTAYAYVIAYNLYGPKNFGVTEVRKLVWKNIGRTLKGFFISWLMIIFIAFMGFAMIGLLATLISMLTMFPVFTSFLVCILFIAGVLVCIPYIWQFSTFYLVQMKDDVGVLDALRRVREVMRGDFFSTWLIVATSGWIILELAVFFSAPQIIYQLMLAFGGLKITGNAIPFVIITTICEFLSKFIYSLFFIINAFLYYTLDEKKYGSVLISRIDEIGNAPVNDVDQHY
jgi:hypothetical protein